VNSSVWIQLQDLQSLLSLLVSLLNAFTKLPSETLNGVRTIRAFKLIKDFIGTNNKKVDMNSAIKFLNIASNRWLAIRLESVGGTVVSFSALFTVVNRANVDPAFAGIAMVYAIQLTNFLSMFIRQYATVETGILIMCLCTDNCLINGFCRKSNQVHRIAN
jgi:hypothetical protein